MEWTKEQNQAIHTENGKLLVAAGAGSGKTTVLVQRIIEKVIHDKVDMDQLLVVTFTNASASEMRERIADALYQKCEEYPDLHKQIMLLNRASIMTIDAFCNKLIRENFFHLGVDPHFQVGEDTEVKLLQLEALDEVMENLYEKNEKLIRMYSNYRSDDSFRQMILQIHRFIQSNPYPLQWLEEKTAMYDLKGETDFGNTIWGKELISFAREELAGCIELTERGIEQLEENPDGKNYFLTLQDDLLQLKAIRSKRYTWDDFWEGFSKLEMVGLKQSPKLDKEIASEIKEIRSQVKEKMQNYFRDTIFVASSEEIMQDMKNLYQLFQQITDVVKQFEEKFQEKKHEKNIIDFADMEHMCLKLLTEHEEVREQYRQQYKEILIDEYQDSNLMQETILNAISCGNIFMVGDVKQSIYKFRQARPELFLEKYHSYAMVDESESDSKEDLKRKILLFQNFRSNRNIIDACNFIFQHVMSKEVGDIDYVKDEFLQFGADYYPYEGTTPEIHLIEKSNKEMKEEEVLDDDIEEKPQLEARVVAKRILDIVGKEEIYDKKTKQMRKVRYGDIAILLRATKGYVDCFVDELSCKNIPVYADVNTGFFENSEVQVIMALLKIIDNPYQDIPLVSVLRSKIGDFNANDLTDIRFAQRVGPFYDAMQLSAGQGNEKARNFLEKLSAWREKANVLRLSELIAMLYDETHYEEYVSVMPNGNVRKANLKSLLQKAEQFDSSSYQGLFQFLRYMEHLQESNGDLGSSKAIGEAEDVVHFMSVHKSKGLEFPIVFLCGTGRAFYQPESKSSLILHQDLGWGADRSIPEKRIYYESIPKLALKRKIREEALSEEMRILYVALTRAREKLIITCLDQKIAKKIEEWQLPQTPYKISHARCFADWIVGTVLSHHADWKIYQWDYQDVLRLKEEKGKEQYQTFVENIERQFHVTEEYQQIDELFKWKYPYDASTRLPSKVTVTELKQWTEEVGIPFYQEEETMPEVQIPQFMQTDIVTGTTFGTIVHQVMQRVPLTAQKDWENVLLSVEEKYRQTIHNYLEQFWQSDLLQEILSAQHVYREMPFNLAMITQELYGDKVSDKSAEDIVLVQGVIDLYFETEDGLVLVDYKTDHLDNEEEFVKKYHSQLSYYRKALETLTKKKVKKVVLYSFYLHKEINV